MAKVLKEFTGRSQYESKLKKWAPRLVLTFFAGELLIFATLRLFGRSLDFKLGSRFGFWPFLQILPLVLLAQWANAYRRDAYGMAGEREVARILRSLPEDFVVLHSLVMPYDQGTFEIDHLVLTPQRGYVLETKNLVGSLRGSPTDKRWTKTKLSNGGRLYASTIQNPIKQNFFHIGKLREWILSQPADSVAGKAQKYWWENIVVLTGDVLLADTLTQAKELCRNFNLAPRLVACDARTGYARLDPEELGRHILATAMMYEGKHRPKTKGLRWNFAMPDPSPKNTARLFVNKFRRRRF